MRASTCFPNGAGTLAGTSTNMSAPMLAAVSAPILAGTSAPMSDPAPVILNSIYGSSIYTI